jgi:hypothetical protein
MIAAEDRLQELATTKHRDYILTPYAPRADPRGRLHNASLLRHLLREAGMLDGAWPMLEALRGLLGVDETVWGLKWSGAGTSLELYFYNFVENAPGQRASANEIAAAVRPWLEFEGEVDEQLPYFMCSFEVDRTAIARRRAAPFRLYLRSGDRHRRECGFSYRAEARGRNMLENHYWFYRATVDAELEDAILRVRNSPRSGSKTCWPTLIPRGLRDCYTICYAVKPLRDGLYYSRISSEQLRTFLSRHGQMSTAAILADHANDFAHVSWDLGFDFAAEPNATAVRIDKMAVHGVV